MFNQNRPGMHGKICQRLSPKILVIPQFVGRHGNFQLIVIALQLKLGYRKIWVCNLIYCGTTRLPQLIGSIHVIQQPCALFFRVDLIQ